MLYVNHTSIDRDALCARLGDLWGRTSVPALQALSQGKAPFEGASVATDQLFVDWVSTCLMDAYKSTGDSAVFALLFELNSPSFLHAIQCNLRRSYHRVDAQDVLQEVFLNIYRYPARFQADRADAFRGWGHRIARNTLIKFLKGQTRLSCFTPIDDEHVQPEDEHALRPDRAASRAERAETVNQAFVLYLQLYLVHFEQLSSKERRALTMVEVEGRSYRDTAAALEIRLENLKMVIFRGRRKIYRGMEASLAGLQASGDAIDAAAAAKASKLSGSMGTSRRRDVSDQAIRRSSVSENSLCDLGS
ncbi:MAG: RNA polymerase sigma factor [Planctomycetota bacterium]|nr:RNA polymerase sigma factor [Planctomycetota bacterium]